MLNSVSAGPGRAARLAIYTLPYLAFCYRETPSVEYAASAAIVSLKLVGRWPPPQWRFFLKDIRGD